MAEAQMVRDYLEVARSLTPTSAARVSPSTLDEFANAYTRLRSSLAREREASGDVRRQLQEAYVGTVEVLANAVEAKDSYTHGHCKRVSRYARLVARRMSLPDREVKLACLAALLHDVGKIGVDSAVLNKPGKLLPDERVIVQSHVRIGHALLEGMPGFSEVAGAVLHHHEWYDGNGYPDGLSGSAIPTVARIVGVVDAFCAMVDHRSYKPARTPEDALDELRRCAGSQFDPEVVEAALDVLPTAVDLPDDDLEFACEVLLE